MKKTFTVGRTFLDMCCEANSCARLSSDNKVKTAKKIVEFEGAFWVCTGSSSQNLTYLDANLDECVPAGLYKGPAYDDESRSYRGMRFSCAHFLSTRFSDQMDWVFTGRQIRIRGVKLFEKNLYRAVR